MCMTLHEIVHCNVICFIRSVNLPILTITIKLYSEKTITPITLALTVTRNHQMKCLNKNKESNMSFSVFVIKDYRNTNATTQWKSISKITFAIAWRTCGKSRKNSKRKWNVCKNLKDRTTLRWKNLIGNSNSGKICTHSFCELWMAHSICNFT